MREDRLTVPDGEIAAVADSLVEDVNSPRAPPISFVAPTAPSLRLPPVQPRRCASETHTAVVTGRVLAAATPRTSLRPATTGRRRDRVTGAGGEAGRNAQPDRRRLSIVSVAVAHDERVMGAPHVLASPVVQKVDLKRSSGASCVRDSTMDN